MIRIFIAAACFWCLVSWAESPEKLQPAPDPKAETSAVASASAPIGRQSIKGGSKIISVTSQEDKKIIKFEPVTTLDINISPEYKNSPKVKKLFQMLKMKTTHDVIHIVDSRTLGRFDLEDNIISARPRSFTSMLDYLSNGVQITRKALEQGIVLAPRLKNGAFFDLNQITKGLLFINMSSQRPHDNVNIEVFYRKHWFYITDNDISSKRTVALMGEIFNLLAGSQASQTPKPILTIPIR